MTVRILEGWWWSPNVKNILSFDIMSASLVEYCRKLRLYKGYCTVLLLNGVDQCEDTYTKEVVLNLYLAI